MYKILFLSLLIIILSFNQALSQESEQIEEKHLNYDYEFIYNTETILVDNKDLKFYKIENNQIEEKLLSEEEIQKIFPDFDIIKISDFTNGIYTVISNNNEKKVLIFNDTDNNFSEYSIIPDKNGIDKNIKGLIQLPKKGKIRLMNSNDKNQKVYTIKVK